jgi:methionyl-tRNA formyltransferase
VRVLDARAESAPAAAPPGVVIAAGADGILVATAAGALRLVAVQPEGRQAMPAAAFCCGYRAGPGDRFG